MATTIKKNIVWLMFIISGFGCSISNEAITICGKKYDMYRDTEYDYEQKLNSTVNILCFRNSKVIAFAYQSAGFRNSDSNLVYTILKHQDDSLIVTTHFNDNVFGYPFQSTRYYRCLENGLVQLYQNGNPDYVITKRTARRNNNKLKKYK